MIKTLHICAEIYSQGTVLNANVYWVGSINLSNLEGKIKTRDNYEIYYHM